MPATAACDRRNQRELVAVRQRVRVVDEVLIHGDAEPAAQLRDVWMTSGERIDGLRDRRALGNLEVFLVAAKSLAEHGEVQDADAHSVAMIAARERDRPRT